MKLVNYILLSGLICFFSCNKYLDIIPDNIATLDYAFHSRNAAEEFLFTCYSYLPKEGDINGNVAFTAGDELLIPAKTQDDITGVTGINGDIARGLQSVVKPIGNIWSNGNESMFKAIRDCNIFLTNINSVRDLQNYEKKRWIAEVRFLKAYYHWLLLRMYGPIPIKDENNPISVRPEDAQVIRQPVDSCFNYIVSLIDLAAEDLPAQIQDPLSELGRLTKLIALSIKARILVTAASPLFNGNTDYAGFKNKNGEQLFSTSPEPQKWVKAVEACKSAIDLAHSTGVKLYDFSAQGNTYNLGPEMKKRMDLRNIVTEPWNSEIIWGNPNSMVQRLQEFLIVPYNQSTGNAAGWYRSFLSPPLKMAQLYYTKNGLPIKEDKTLDYSDITQLRTATADEKFEIKPGYETARLNFDREPRYYANIGFDGGILFGAGNFDENNCWHYAARKGQYSTLGSSAGKNFTGIFCKKLVSYLNTMSNSFAHSVLPYPYPVIRLSDLYLLYAEALNEAVGPGVETYKWIDSVRSRAGIPSVEESWSQYATNPSEYTNKDGLRKIIRTERLIEMAFEGNRFWDLRRWKESEKVLNSPIQGWNMNESDPASYSKLTLVFDQSFYKRDYFWPIAEQDIIENKNLVQNPGW